MTTTTYAVTGLTCEHCVNAVTEEVSGVEGVTDVAVALVLPVVGVFSAALAMARLRRG